MKIEEILENDDCITDISSNQNTKFKRMITTANILILIRLCIKPNESLKENSQKSLRYTFYSCQILCSKNFLLFNKSINIIKESNKFENSSQKSKDNENSNKINDNNSLSSDIGDEVDNSIVNEKEEHNFINPNKEDIFIEPINKSANLENDDGFYEDFFHMREDESSNDIKDIYVEIKNPLTETDFRKDRNPKIIKTSYDKEEMDIINEILNEIFSVLDSETYENQTYLGYFQKIVNYLLYYETKLIIDYLFKDSIPIINKLYSHLNNASIQNILENILNILSDNEDDYENFTIESSKYAQIIFNLLNQLKSDEKFEKAEFICNLIINTLINNSEKHLIELIFNDKDNTMMKNVKDIIERKINKDKEGKILIPIIQLLCNLNNCFIKSLNDSLSIENIPNYLNSFIYNNNNINTFDYQYFRKVTISSMNIANAFKNKSNIIKYFTYLNDIYIILAKDINKKWENNNQKENINKIVINEKENYKVFGLKNLYEWKYILSSMKIYIYSIYTDDISNNGYNHYFFDEKLFITSMRLYFHFIENSIYQNIFVEMIKLICDERCPKYLIRPFLKKYENNENNFINIIANKIIKLNLKENNNNKKKNISLGTDFEILKCFYSSTNKKILNYFEKYILDKKYKDIFLKSISSEIERKIGEIYEYSESEIFDSDNDNNNTFDGNNGSIQKEFPTIEKIIDKFSKKCKKAEISIIENNNIIKNKMIINNENSKDTLRIKTIKDSDNNKIIEMKKISEITNKDNEEIKMETKFIIKEDDDEDNLKEEKEQNEIQSHNDIKEIIKYSEIFLKETIQEKNS